MTKKVYQAIAKVQAELAKDGISKARSNQQQGYKFRGIDDIYNALASLLADSHLCILPRMKSREITERINKNGTALFYVVVEADFDFVSSEDGSLHTVTMYGEAMDSGDKATNKAMSAAYKYACMQAFCIPTEGDNDADATTHEVAAKPQSAGPLADSAEFRSLVAQAHAASGLSEKERQFVNDQHARIAQLGAKATATVKQVEWLRKLVSRVSQDGIAQQAQAVMASRPTPAFNDEIPF